MVTQDPGVWESPTGPVAGSEGRVGERRGYFRCMRLGLPDGTFLEKQEMCGPGEGRVPPQAPFPGRPVQPGEEELGRDRGMLLLWGKLDGLPNAAFPRRKRCKFPPKRRFFRKWSEVLRSMDITGMSTEMGNTSEECHGGG